MNGWKRFPFSDFLSKVDWKLLSFLILLVNVKFAVKVVALAFFILWEYRSVINTARRIKDLPLFYPLIIVWALLCALLNSSFSRAEYGYVFGYGVFLWLACFLCFLYIKTLVERKGTGSIYYTLIVFFILNAAVSFGTLLSIIIETGALNPYRYQGNYQKYFISTGDYIKGLSFDTSTTNAALNAFGVIFFLRRPNYLLVILCMAILILTCSNTINLLLLITLIFVFIRAGANQRSISLACFFLLVVFMARVSPQNNDYVTHVSERIAGFKAPDNHSTKINEVNPDSVRYRIAQSYLDSMSSNRPVQTMAMVTPNLPQTETHRIYIPGDSIHTPRFQHRDAANPLRDRLLLFAKTHGKYPIADSSRIPGKIIALNQTCRFLMSSPVHLLAGAGPGNYSSKLAFKAAGIGIAGNYPFPSSVDTQFQQNHLNVFIHFFTKTDGQHSLINLPNSVYHQMAGEYGLIGFGLLLLYYLGFFLRKTPLRNGFPLLLLMAGLLALDYWFEQLSTVPFFELLMLYYQKENIVAYG